MIPVLTPIARTVQPLNRDYWHATEQFDLARRNGDVRALKYWAGELDRIEATHAE
jgi:hypothetical protein